MRGQSDYDLFVMRADGRHERNLTNSPGVDEIHPDWSPDGDRIAFASDRDGDSEIYTMKLDGSRVRQLTTNTATDVDPVLVARRSHARLRRAIGTPSTTPGSRGTSTRCAPTAASRPG